MRGPVALVTAALSAVLGVSVAASAATSLPSVRLTAAAPLTLRGIAFKSSERVTVRVSVSLPPNVSRFETRASRTGSFAIELGELRIGRCGSVSVRATGSRGSVATLKRPPLPACLRE